MKDTFSFFGTHKDVQACAFWCGDHGQEDISIVRAMIVPQQSNSWRRVKVTSKALEAVSDLLEDNGWKILAQVTTSPGRRAEHTVIDDTILVRDGRLSIIFPTARRRAAFPACAGVHEFQNDYWHLLSQEDVTRRIVFSAIDEHWRIWDLR